MDALLVAAAPYKKRDPAGEDERELCENIFQCLCSALMQPVNKAEFRQAEGIELMLMIIREKKYGRKCAVKVLDYLLTNDPLCCEHCVDAGGLKSIFPVFMGKSLKKKYHDQDEMRAVEELGRAPAGSLRLPCRERFFERGAPARGVHPGLAVQVLYGRAAGATHRCGPRSPSPVSVTVAAEPLSMCAANFSMWPQGNSRRASARRWTGSASCSSATATSSPRSTPGACNPAAATAQQPPQVCSRCGRYKAVDEARAADPRWAAASAEDRAAVEAEEKEERYLERLEAGLYTLQLLAALLASIWGAEGPRARALMLLHQQSVELGAVRAVLEEYATSVGETAQEGADADGAAAKEKREGAAAEAESIRALASFLVVGD